MYLIFFLIIIIKLVLAASEDGEHNDYEEETSNYDWLTSMLLVPLSSAGIFTMYSTLLRHRSPWSALYSTAVSAASLLPSFYTIFLHVRLPFLMKTIFYGLRGQTYLSEPERSLIRRLWMVSAAFILFGAVPLFPIRQIQQSKIFKRVFNYYSTTIIGLGIFGFGCATCVSLLLPASARRQIFNF